MSVADVTPHLLPTYNVVKTMGFPMTQPYDQGLLLQLSLVPMQAVTTGNV